MFLEMQGFEPRTFINQEGWRANAAPDGKVWMVCVVTIYNALSVLNTRQFKQKEKEKARPAIMKQSYI